ncbi:MAG: hypothetical protein WCF78_01180 [archaeon]
MINKKLLIYGLIGIIVVIVVIGAILFMPKTAKSTSDSNTDKVFYNTGATQCEEYQSIFTSVLISLNPKECNAIDNDVCKNTCLASYAWAALDKDYCKYNSNPLNPLDVSGEESCVVHIAEMNQDKTVCDGINFNLEGYGYLNYRNQNKEFYSCFGIKSEDVNGIPTYSDTLCARTEPKTNCYTLSTGYSFGSSYKSCDNIDVSDDLKDICYLNFVVFDVSNPKYTGTLPFTCNEMKTDKGKTFCEELSTDVTKLRNRGIGTLIE